MTGEPVRPLTLAVAVSLLVPDFVPRVQTTDASPCELVEAEVAERCPPPAVTAKVTETPETPAPDAVVTLTTRGCRTACPTVPDWLLPETCAMADGTGGGLVASPPPPQLVTPANMVMLASGRTRLSQVTPCMNSPSWGWFLLPRCRATERR